MWCDSGYCQTVKLRKPQALDDSPSEPNDYHVKFLLWTESGEWASEVNSAYWGHKARELRAIFQ